jgi:hypothetical protein
MISFGQRPPEPPRILHALQFVGRAAKIIMEEVGYVPVDAGVKLPNDPVFRTGTR